MFIKKVIVTWPEISSCHPYLRILFYDQDGNLFESGSTISSTGNKAETDNFIVTAVNGTNNPDCCPINAISTEVYKDINDVCAAICLFAGIYSRGDIFTIEFKTTQLISKIKVCIKPYSNAAYYATLRVIDIKDNEESYIINDASNAVGYYT